MSIEPVDTNDDAAGLQTPATPDNLEVRHEPDQPVCPMPETHDKFTESHYFIERMMHEYHTPQPFRWSLNAFIQALRSVTFRLQKELRGHAGFDTWYSVQQEVMKADPLLRAFVEGRNIVVKERNLTMRSSVKIGYFRYRKPKQWIATDIDPNIPSEYLLRVAAPKLNLIPADHPALGEEYGVERTWHSDELGEGSVLALCDAAWSRVGRVVVNAHHFVELNWEGPPEHGHDPSRCNTLTETDLDPSLPEKWGWT